MREGGKKASNEKYRPKIIHQHLSRDHHPTITFVAVRTVAVIEQTLLDLLSDAEPEERKDEARSAEPETAAGRRLQCLQSPLARMILLPLCYQAGLRDDIR